MAIAPGASEPALATVSALPRPRHVLISRWRRDRYALGSYSFLARGARSEHRAWLAEPIGDRIFFAGEATSQAYPATVHGALLSGRQAAQSVARTGARRVAVIGAGVAGLAAAHCLGTQGRDCVVLEARDRIGGRVWTDRTSGVPIDLGASWIHGVRGNPLTRLARQVDADLVPTDDDNLVIRDADGRDLDHREVPDWFWDVVWTEHEFAADLDTLSPAALDEGEAFGGPHVIFPGGYDQLLAGLSGDYEVRLSAPVTTIRHGGGGVDIAAAGRPPERFDAALVTVPLGVLKAGAIRFEPCLPARKRAAIDRLGMGLLNKVCLVFDQVFWDTGVDVFGYVGPERRRFAAWLNLAKHTGEPVLMAFNAGSTADALESVSDGEIAREAMTVLRPLLTGRP